MLVLLLSSVLTAETLHYYVEGRKVELTEDLSSYSFIRTSLTKANFVLPQNVKIIKTLKNVSIIEVPDETTKASLTKNGLLFPAYIKNGAKVYVGGRLFVKIPGKPNAADAEKWCKEHGLTLVERYEYIPEWYLVSVEGNPIKKAAELVESKAVKSAEPSFLIKAEKRAYIPNDPLFSNQWHLHNNGSNSKLSGSDHAHVAEAWEVMMAFKGNSGGKGIKLAIVDDGFDLDHEDLAGRFTDGYDFGDNDTDPTYNPNKYYPDEHGTACAGVAGAAQNNGKGVSGACPNCTLIPIRIDLDGYTSMDESAIKAFQWAANAGADIISNSWGPADNQGAEDMSTSLKNLVTELTTTIKGRKGKGINIFFAAGNGGESIETDGFASNLHVFAIGATKADGQRCSYSDFGNSLDFMAPSSDFSDYDNDHDGYCDTLDGIWTVDNTGRDGYNSGKSSLGDSQGNYTNDFGGTSSACPLAAGITGLVLAANPDLTRDQIYAIYADTSDEIGNPIIDKTLGCKDYNDHFSNCYGYGRINACEAVKEAFRLGGKDVSQVTCGGTVINPGDIDDSYPDDSDTVDTGDSGDSGDTGDSGDSTDTSDTSDTADTTDTTDTTDTAVSPNCGNGVIDAGEICDGNSIPCAQLAGAPKNGTAVCAFDCMGWDRSGCYDGESSDDAEIPETCGNGILDDDEQCDDGNRISGDGCSKYCMNEDSEGSKSNGGCSLDLLQ